MTPVAVVRDAHEWVVDVATHRVSRRSADELPVIPETVETADAGSGTQAAPTARS